MVGQQSPPRKRSIWFWIGVICVTLALLAVGLIGAGVAFVFYISRNFTPPPPVRVVSGTPPAQAQVKEAWSITVGAPITEVHIADLDGKGQKLLVVDQSGAVSVVDFSGKSGATLSTGMMPRISAGDLNGDSQMEVVAATMHTPSGITAIDAKNSSLWKYQLGILSMPDSVAVHDLDGDGKAETAVGYNGFTGLHLLDSGGQLKWKYTGIGNVWNVSTGRVMGDGKWYVLATDAGGQVTVFDATGKVVAQVRPSGLYCSHVYTADLNGDNVDEILAVGSSMTAGNTQMISCANWRGLVSWNAALSADDHDTRRQLVSAGDFNGDGTIDVVVLCADGSFRIIDANGTARVKHATGAKVSGVCALQGQAKGKQQFVVGLGSKLVCYQEVVRASKRKD